MIFKSLILQGFKSFPDRTEIRFEGGMTAIVGPNGSGKSNISDAIRWVLGEQSSRSLRGARMEDVIFSGTQRRRAVGFAEVSLILDNAEGVFRSEYTEIMVTRRYYRSGESEYSLNGRHCRLKDIHELFMDTGIGRDGYSIIGQGRIDEILSLKSEDRREIFEEAAGVTKFRYRKEEAARRLEATEENLVRIRDLYAELEKQAGPLEKQAEKAKAYLVLRDELRVIEVSLWLEALARIRADCEKLTEDVRTCDGQLEEAKATQQRLYERSEQLTESLREADIQTDALRRTLRTAEERRAERESRCAVLRANIQNTEENIVRARTEGERRAEQAQSLTEQLEARESRCAALDAEAEQLTARQTAVRETVQAYSRAAEEAASQCAALAEALREQEAARFQAELARTAAQTGLDGLEERRTTIDSDVARGAAELAAEGEIHAARQADYDACVHTLEADGNRLAGAARKEEHRRSRVEELTAARAALVAERTDTGNRIRMLREMEREYEGFSQAVRRIMQQHDKGGLTGVHGPVSTLIEVDDRYILAIETALGAAASNIVVDRAVDGKNCIAFLKRTDGGRATFLPLDTIRQAELRESGLEDQTGFCGTADLLVRCAPAYRSVVSNLLARTVVAEDMDCALRIARAYRNRFRIVTLDGQVIQAGGAMTGGSASRSTGVLARAAKLRALEQHAGEQAAQQQEMDKRLAAAKEELAAMEYERKALEAERLRAQEEKTRLEALLGQHTALLSSLRMRQEGLTLERDNLDAARQRYTDELQTQAKALEEIDAARHALEDERAQAEEALHAEQQRREAAEQEVIALESALTANRTEAAAERRAAEDLNRLRREMEDGQAGTDQVIRQFEEQAERMREELAQTEAERTNSGQEIERLQSQIADRGADRMRIEGERTTIDRQAQDKNREILELERESGRLAAKGVQLKNEENNILDRMWESYELTPTPAEQVRIPLPDPAAARTRADHLRGEMRALGNVNLDAVEQYAALMERFEFLRVQKDDLENAQRDLQKVIDQLTVRMKEIFASEFAKLNHYFGETFREIFGGGHAELQLADTSDILNCGIDIKVSPPGKSVKTLTLLSGGEKAFVAIALYFAILKVRPTPFCVLDEIEAALDDVNVARYAQYLRRLCDQTQFIVITHRRGTMEEADMLYGVTMQEQGVSRLLMLNLAEAERRFSGTIA